MSEYNETEVLNMLQGAQALHPLMGEPGVIGSFQQEHGLSQQAPAAEQGAPQVSAQNNWDFLKGPGA